MFFQPAKNLISPENANSNEQAAPDHKELPLNYARTLSWLSLAVILLTSLSLSFFISHSARETLLTKQKEFARQLVENLNSQIFRRFALPTILANGLIALRKPTQYAHLDRVVRSVIQGLPVEHLRIYDFSYLTAYSTKREETGQTGLAPPQLNAVLQDGISTTEIVSLFPTWQAPFRIPLKPGSFVLRVLSPLRGESFTAGEESPIMGALELTQDITDDYERVLAFQGIIVVMCLLSSIVLFALLLVLIQRSERVLEERMHKNHLLEKQLHSNERLASMGRVVASIAHEIRNPLGIIRSSAELLKRRTDKADAGTMRLLGAIYDEAVRLSQTVNDFLDYARPRTPRQELVELNIVLNQAIAFLESDFRQRQVQVERHTAPELFVRGDKDLLYRAFYNIMINGQQAMNGPGILYIEGHKEGDIILTFRDSGPGFDLNLVDKIMDPFVTTKEGGTGLGLPIVNSIITSHGGQIALSNAPAGGAVVQVRLPTGTNIELEAHNE